MQHQRVARRTAGRVRKRQLPACIEMPADLLIAKMEGAFDDVLEAAAGGLDPALDVCKQEFVLKRAVVRKHLRLRIAARNATRREQRTLATAERDWHSPETDASNVDGGALRRAVRTHGHFPLRFPLIAPLKSPMGRGTMAHLIAFNLSCLSTTIMFDSSSQAL